MERGAQVRGRRQEERLLGRLGALGRFGRLRRLRLADSSLPIHWAFQSAGVSGPIDHVAASLQADGRPSRSHTFTFQYARAPEPGALPA